MPAKLYCSTCMSAVVSYLLNKKRKGDADLATVSGVFSDCCGD
jgi:hypothetical protein